MVILIIAKCSNRVTYYIAECSIRVTALLEYLDCTFVTPVDFHNVIHNLIPCKLLKDRSEIINLLL